ncbi:aldo/keto reductase [candidate division KSB1 bacterium]|nr:aldo/keto reductase [candidate division KSB1 bacterium]
MPRRKLGRHPEQLSIIGFGGIVVKDEDQSVANNAVARAFDRGVNYFDVAPSYGNAEEKLGPALKPYREKCFLACKTERRTSADAERELNDSLKQMQTDHFDLYQLHAITTKEDVETAFGPNGAMELFVRAKQEGKVRYLGFSAHTEEAALSAMEKFDFDTVLFPINFVCWYEGNFGPRVVERAKEKNMGILALKSLAYSKLKDRANNPNPKCWYQPVDYNDTALLRLALSFTLSQSVTAAIPPGEPRYFWRALDLASAIQTIDAGALNEIRNIASGVEPLFES